MSSGLTNGLCPRITLTAIINLHMRGSFLRLEIKIEINVLFLVQFSKMHINYCINADVSESFEGLFI